MTERETRDVTGLDDVVVIGRDGHGIPHVEARTERDAWFGLGFAAAEDRLWQLEYDRRRACGRWAEVVGAEALPADRLARRLDLPGAARADVAAMDDATRAAFTTYAAGVEACVETRGTSPEHEACGLDWEPWQVWHSVAAFKVRHVLMGAWQHKLARAVVLASEGTDAFDWLDPGPLPGMRVSVPAGERIGAPTAEVRALLAAARADVESSAEHLGFLAEVEAGSNAWAVAGSRTTTGAPVLCNDSHRALDVPNVYWQAHLSYPGAAVSGGTFPGIPGFPHFGHNGHVGWAITNAAADAQDVLVERFRAAGDGVEVSTPDGWVPAETSVETIDVRGGGAETLTCYRTPNGPVVHGDPRDGVALSLRWTATARPCRQFGVMRRMLAARTVGELLDAQDGWVDPMNNLLAADTSGNIGYLLRGELPRRARPALHQVPLPGWQRESAWSGVYPFASMPRQENPPGGVIASANNCVVEPSAEIGVGYTVNDFYRVERIHELLDARDVHGVAELAGYQGDVTSIPARRWGEVMGRRGPYDGDAERSRQVLAGLDGRLDGASGTPLLYACFRRCLAEALLGERLGPSTVAFLLRGPMPAAAVLARRWFARLTWPTGPGEAWPADAIDDVLLARVLRDAWQDAVHAAGPDPRRWRWDELHRLTGVHTVPALREAYRGRIDAGVGGDSETVQNASYPWGRRAAFPVTNTAVYRQVLDLADLSRSLWVIPSGASGDLTSPNATDQVATWQRHHHLPMTRHPAAEACRILELRPTSRPFEGRP
ncbi:MAG TPA: penicillin acylase family protein [Streptosporangiales bacterium]